jgi:hypothetical protein
MNGFQATVGIVNPNQGVSGSGTTSATADLNQDRFGVEGKASYSFAANDVTGKIWVSGIAQKVSGFTVENIDSISYAGDIGANVNMAGFGLTGYYYNGSGIGSTGQQVRGYGVQTVGGKAAARDSDGGYVQATYVLPTKTKAGISWGISKLDRADGETGTGSNILLKSNEMWTAGLYHPLTKHLNLVAEYSHVKAENQAGAENKNNIGSLGAILFF